MNKYIYKVIKWLEDPDSVSQEERDKNKEEAKKSLDSIYATYATHNDASILDASYAAYSSAYFAADNDQEAAARWVNNYFEETGEDKQDYINAIGGEK